MSLSFCLLYDIIILYVYCGFSIAWRTGNGRIAYDNYLLCRKNYNFYLTFHGAKVCIIGKKFRKENGKYETMQMSEFYNCFELVKDEN